ncbi:hypothetical protein AQS8620_00908 [Aquimixticola soesokkakensis]|uniref:Phosphoadenosine phosphosulfate reductase n=1 Tax=Aquimixticola soesokkakensis TaxID=1519096 RepID=A0A1Y5S033_9RHOB|nr:hypothetical protein [Aquimixticola soesokkakensis]SLN29404.1 hypothetical protein AQS8620_00908 [Aquimixticola soesokkakensis]
MPELMPDQTHARMSDAKQALTADPSEMTFDEWLAAVEELGEDRGFFEPLGPDHSAVFTDEGDCLLVTFESVDDMMVRSEDGLPLGFALADPHGWSQLTLFSHDQTQRPSWFRHRAIYGFLDRLTDEDFFDRYQKVVFYGSGAAGYAAAAYSVAAPGATVVALAPQATQAALLASWDHRHPKARAMDFSSRYGFAPDMVEAAQSAFVFFDPLVAEDAMHAALFARPHVTLKPCRFFGERLEEAFIDMDILGPLLKAAMDDRLTLPLINKLLRRRKGQTIYHNEMLKSLRQSDRPALVAHLARFVLTRRNAPRYRRALQQARTELSAKGFEPDWLLEDPTRD